MLRLPIGKLAAMQSWNRKNMRQRALLSWWLIKDRHRRVRKALHKSQRGPVVILKGMTNQRRIKLERMKRGTYHGATQIS